MNKEIINLFKKLVTINSVFPKEYKLAIFLERALIKRGFNVKRQPVSKGRFNVLAQKGRGAKSLMFYGHIDTVDVCSGWSTDPFKLVYRKDRLYGLGARDMKAGIVAILKAIEKINPTTFKLKIAFCVDEENISQGAFKLCQDNWVKDILGIISADSGATVKKINLPINYILGRRGRVVFALKILGKSAHGAVSNDGVNSVTEAARAILSLDKIAFKQDKDFGSGTLFPKKIFAKAKGLTLPEKTILELDRQLTLNENVDETLLQIKKVLERQKINGTVSLKARKTSYLMPYKTDTKNKLVGLIDSILRKNYSCVEYAYGLSVGDENVFANKLNIPVVSLGPIGNNAHAANEWVCLKSIKELINIYQAILKEFPQIL